MRKIFLLFVDSFPYDCLPELRFLSQFRRWQIACGVGYSVNIKAELFAGCQPDDVGYLNQWQYTPQSSFRPYSSVLKLLVPFSVNYWLDRMMHKALGRLVFRRGLLSIPFGYLPFFDSQGTSAYSDGFPKPTVFSRCNGMLKLRYTDLRPGIYRDQELFATALDAIQNAEYDVIFVASADLDHETHLYGVGSPQHWEKLRSLDTLISQSVSMFFGRYPDGQFIMISDHSMANVTQAIDFDLEGQFGPANEDTYLYFVDSNMLRIWVFRPDLEVGFQEYLLGWHVGRVVSAHERIQYGLAREEFGSFIFILDEGLVFRRSFWGQGVLKAMHGYHPDTVSQKGFLVSNDMLFHMGQVVPSLRVFDKLCEECML